MKKLLLLSALSFSLIASAQKVKPAAVPEAVKNKVTALYPNAEIEEWIKEGDNYEAEVEIAEGKEVSVLLTASGDVLETETEIAVADLPQGAKDYVAKNLAGKKIKEASKIVKSDNTVLYEAEVSGTDYIFDASGNFVKSEK